MILSAREMGTPEMRLKLLLPLDSGKRNKRDAQNPMGEEPGPRGVAWILGWEGRTDITGEVTAKMGDRQGAERGVIDSGHLDRSGWHASGLACEHGVRGLTREWKLEDSILWAGSMRRVIIGTDNLGANYLSPEKGRILLCGRNTRV